LKFITKESILEIIYREEVSKKKKGGEKIHFIFFGRERLLSITIRGVLALP